MLQQHAARAADPLQQPAGTRAQRSSNQQVRVPLQIPSSNQQVRVLVLQQPAGTRATSSSPAARARSLVLTLVNVIAIGLLLISVSLYDLLAVVAGAANIRA